MTSAKNTQLNYGCAVINDTPCGDTATIAATGLGRSGTTMLARTMFEIGVPMWDRLTPQSCEDKLIQTQIKGRDLDAFSELCKTRNAQTPRWGFKCPALRNQMSDTAPLMTSPRFIVVFRDMLAVSMRNNLSIGSELFEALDRAETGYRKMVQEIKKLDAPVLLISYEKALQHPIYFVQSVADFCGYSVESHQAGNIAESAVRNSDPRYLGSRS